MPWLRRIALVLAVLGLAALALSGPLTRFGLVPFQAGIGLLLLGGLLGSLAVPVSLAGFLMSRQKEFVLAGVVGAASAVMPAYSVVQARSVPPINDISTDAGEMRFPEAQRKAYADIQPLRVASSPRDAFEKSFAAARAMNWEIVKSDAAAGRIEAIDTTGWFGFKDDVTVRVSPDGPGSRIDIRSRSRLGKGDAGANAKRIRDYFLRLR